MLQTGLGVLKNWTVKRSDSAFWPILQLDNNIPIEEIAINEKYLKWPVCRIEFFSLRCR